MNHSGALCPDGDSEQGLRAGSSQEKELCSPVASSSSNHGSLQETYYMYFLVENTSICKYASVKDIVISILFILVITLTVVLIQVKRTELQSHTLISAAHCSASCPHRWIGYEGKCYFFSKEKRNWTSSQQFCSVYNASLACLESEEKDFVMRIKGEGTYWIGLTKKSDQSWVWPNGEHSMMKATGEDDCVYLDNEASSSGCHAELPCICSKAAGYTSSQQQ